MADLVTQEVEFKTLAPSQQSFEQLYGVSPDNQTQIDEVNQFLQTYQGVDEININGNLHQWNPYSNPPAYRPV
jgi:cell division protein FtsX